MEILNNYILFTCILLLVVFNVLTAREAILYPLFTTRYKLALVILIWLVPLIGLYVAYKKMRLKPSFSSSNNGDDTQVITEDNND